jgi:hypothetical protein
MDVPLTASNSHSSDEMASSLTDGQRSRRVTRERMPITPESFDQLSIDDTKLADLLIRDKGDLLVRGEHDQPERVDAPRMSLMDMLNSASERACVAKTEGRRRSGELNEIAHRQRRKSKELEYVAYGMDLSKVLALKKSFTEIDLNGNGKIDVTELKECLRNARTVVPADDVLKQAIKDFDSDNDGELTFDEFQALVRHCEGVA